jgi:hypothetical protein
MIEPAVLATSLSTLLAEVFGVTDSPESYMLESGHAGLMGTINALSAATASAALTPSEPTIAAHCGHILFLLSFFSAYEQGQTPAADWEGSWTTRLVDEPAWAALRGQLQSTYDIVVARFTPDSPWPEPRVGAAILLLAHCSYHVGQIRQLLTALRVSGQAKDR